MKDNIVKNHETITADVFRAAIEMRKRTDVRSWNAIDLLGQEQGINHHVARWAYVAAGCMTESPYVAMERNGQLVIVPDPVDDSTRFVLIYWEAETAGHECRIAGTDRRGEQQTIALPLGTLLFQEDALIGNLYLLPDYAAEERKKAKPGYRQIEPHQEFARELRASAKAAGERERRKYRKAYDQTHGWMAGVPSEILEEMRKEEEAEREAARPACPHCGVKRRSYVVFLNANSGLDGLGRYNLDDHSPSDALKCFCNDAHLLAFLREHPEEARVCVPYEHTASDYKYCMGCAHCGKQDGLFLAVDGQWGSVLDSINRPAYFCSVGCVIAEVTEAGGEERAILDYEDEEEV